jgi:hypothetical protein
MISKISNFSGPNSTIFKKRISVGDAIRTAIGSTYQSAYDASTIGNWIEVNSTAYNNVLSQVTGATVYGMTEAVMTGANGTGWGAFMISNSSQTAVPAGNYVLAWSAIPSNGGSQIIYTSSSLNSNNYTKLGNTISVTGSTRKYFVRKAPTTSTSTNTYFAVYSSSGSITRGSYSNTVYKSGGGDTVAPPFSNWTGPSAAPAFQYLVTSTLSW